MSAGKTRPPGCGEGSSAGLRRREMLELMGGGLVVLIYPPAAWAALQGRRRSGAYPEDPNAYLLIGADGRVSCFSGKIEMGQGIVTSLGQMLADELDVPLGVVDVVLGDTALCPWDRGTFGSRTTKYFGPALRLAAARARAELLLLGAQRLGVAGEHLGAADGAIFDRRDPARRVSYGELVAGRRIERRVATPVHPKAASERRIAGKPTLRTDARAKVSGQARYAADLRAPGMVYARILRPPAHGAKLVSADTAAAERIEGVRIIRDGDLIAVLHERPDVAERALARVVARFSQPAAQVDDGTIFEHLEKAAPPARVVTRRGDLAAGRAAAARHFENTYRNHYVAHAPMEPHAALVWIEADRVTVWASTQSPFRVQGEVAAIAGVPPGKVRVITPFVGGGFGGKTRGQQVAEATRLAKLSGRPVQVAWTRAEEFCNDTFRPAALIKVSTGLDAAGKMTYWHYDNFFAGTRSSQPIYDIPHQRVLSRGGRRAGSSAHPFGVGAWRGPGSNTNVFAMESQVDLMAAAAGKDPLSFRREHLGDARMRRVLECAAEAFARPWARAPSGRGYGVACTDYLGTYVVAMAEVELDEKKAAVRVVRVVCAQDMGEVINPEGARLQIEGGITMGLGYVLRERIRFRGGEILDTNFDTYEIPRFSWLPAIEVVLVANDEMAPQGCGEPAITAMGAVIANAVHDACGVRIFELPMTPELLGRRLREGR